MQKESYQADQSPRGMTGTKQGIRPIDSDLQKSVIKMPFLMRGNPPARSKDVSCQLGHQTEPGHRDLLCLQHTASAATI